MGIMLDTPEAIAAYFKLARYHALKLEVNTGLHHSRGSVAEVIRKDTGLTNSKKAELLEEYKALLIKEGILKNA